MDHCSSIREKRAYRGTKALQTTGYNNLNCLRTKINHHSTLHLGQAFSRLSTHVTDLLDVGKYLIKIHICRSKVVEVYERPETARVCERMSTLCGSRGQSVSFTGDETRCVRARHIIYYNSKVLKLMKL